MNLKSRCEHLESKAITDSRTAEQFADIIYATDLKPLSRSKKSIALF